MPILVIFKSVWTYGIMQFNSSWTICQFCQVQSQLHFVLLSIFLPFANQEDSHTKMNWRNSFFFLTIISGNVPKHLNYIFLKCLSLNWCLNWFSGVVKSMQIGWSWPKKIFPNLQNFVEFSQTFYPFWWSPWQNWQILKNLKKKQSLGPFTLIKLVRHYFTMLVTRPLKRHAVRFCPPKPIGLISSRIRTRPDWFYQ